MVLAEQALEDESTELLGNADSSLARCSGESNAFRFGGITRRPRRVARAAATKESPEETLTER